MKLALAFIAVMTLFGCQPGWRGEGENEPSEQRSEGEDGSQGGDELKSVDVQNPKTTGPSGDPKSQLNLYVTDAPIVDTAQALFIKVQSVRLYETSPSPGKATKPSVIAQLSGPAAKEFNLLDFRNGKLHPLLSLKIPAGTYRRVELVLAEGQNVRLELATGELESVYIPSQDNQSRVIFAEKAFNAPPGSAQDIVLHADVRRQLRSITDDQRQQWFSGTQDNVNFNYWLNPRVELFPVKAVSQVTATGLNELFKVACISRPEVALDDNWQCTNASFTTVAEGGRFVFPFLIPQTEYRIRLFLTETIYLDIPNLVSARSGESVTLDLGDLSPDL